MNLLTADLLAILRRHPVVRTARVVAFDETPSGRVELKIRCRLQRGFNFQLWLHLEPASVDYAYQLFTQAPLLRWERTALSEDCIGAASRSRCAERGERLAAARRDGARLADCPGGDCRLD